MFTITQGKVSKDIRAKDQTELVQQVRRAFGFKDFMLLYEGLEFILNQKTSRPNFHYQLSLVPKFSGSIKMDIQFESVDSFEEIFDLKRTGKEIQQYLVGRHQPFYESLEVKIGDISLQPNEPLISYVKMNLKNQLMIKVKETQREQFLAQKIKEFEEQINKQNEKINENQEQLKKEQYKNESLNNSLELLNQTISDLNDAQTQLEYKLQDTKQQLVTQQRIFASTNQEKEQTSQQYEELMKQLEQERQNQEKQKKQRQDLIAKLNSSNAEKLNLQQQLRHQQQQFQLQFEQSQTQIQTLTDQILDWNKKFNNLEAEKSKLEVENNNLKEDLKFKDQTITELKNKTQKIEREREEHLERFDGELEQERKKFKEKQLIFDSDVAKLKQEIQQLKEQLESTEFELMRTRTELGTLQTQKAEIEKLFDNKSSESKEQKEQRKSFEQKTASLTHNLDREKLINEKLTKDKEALQKEMENLIQQNAELDGELRRTKESEKKLNDELTSQISKLKISQDQLTEQINEFNLLNKNHKKLQEQSEKEKMQSEAVILKLKQTITEQEQQSKEREAKLNSDLSASKSQCYELTAEKDKLADEKEQEVNKCKYQEEMLKAAQETNQEDKQNHEKEIKMFSAKIEQQKTQLQQSVKDVHKFQRRLTNLQTKIFQQSGNEKYFKEYLGEWTQLFQSEPNFADFRKSAGATIDPPIPFFLFKLKIKSVELEKLLYDGSIPFMQCVEYEKDPIQISLERNINACQVEGTNCQLFLFAVKEDHSVLKFDQVLGAKKRKSEVDWYNSLEGAIKDIQGDLIAKHLFEQYKESIKETYPNVEKYSVGDLYIIEKEDSELQKTFYPVQVLKTGPCLQVVKLDGVFQYETEEQRILNGFCQFCLNKTGQYLTFTNLVSNGNTLYDMLPCSEDGVIGADDLGQRGLGYIMDGYSKIPEDKRIKL